MASGRLIFLVHSDHQYQVDTLKDILEAQGIPVIVRSKDSGAYLQIYMGTAWTGFDLYVPEERLDDARQAINFLDTEPGRWENDDIPYNNYQEREDPFPGVPGRLEKKYFLWLALALILGLFISLLFLYRN